PVVRLEEAPRVVHRYARQLAVDRYARVVDPRVDPAELRLGEIRRLAMNLLVRNVTGDVRRPLARRVQIADDRLQGRLVPRGQYDARTALDGQPGGSEPDAARRSGYYHHLVFDGLQSDLHHASCNSAAVLPGPADPLLRGGIRRCVEGAFCMPVSESGSCTYEHL